MQKSTSKLLQTAQFYGISSQIDKDNPRHFLMELYMLTKTCAAILLCLFILVPLAAHGEEQDPVIQTIEKALDEYKKQNYSSAATNLDYASQLIRQKKGEALSAFLPEALEGWTANESKSQVTAASLFGGGLTAERDYSREDAKINIAIITDSPLLQPMIMMFSNPIFAASAGRFELINGYKGIIKHQNNNGDVNIVVNNRFLVTVKGRNVSEETLVDYAKHIDLKGVAELP